MVDVGKKDNIGFIIDEVVRMERETSNDAKSMCLFIAEKALLCAAQLECDAPPDWKALEQAYKALEDLL